MGRLGHREIKRQSNAKIIINDSSSQVGNINHTQDNHTVHKQLSILILEQNLWIEINAYLLLTSEFSPFIVLESPMVLLPLVNTQATS